MTDATRAPAPPTLAPVRRADYRPPAWLVDDVTLDIALDPTATVVRSRLTVRRNPLGDGGALRLDGEAITLVSAAVDGAALGANRINQEIDGLRIDDLPDRCTLELVVRHAPADNTELSGLYVSGGNYVTQCEAEGFRRITFFPDRPDVMARYDVTLRAAAEQCPVLLANGNPAGEGVDADGRRWARWIDPHPKPSYLFALVAGDLVAVRDRFRTRSGRDVALAIWVRGGDEGRCGFAMRALKRSMAWDEERYGLEYDLEMFNIVAVSDFNAGAMENKGLNIFNTRYVLADEDRATDDEILAVETVIAHEYFHNWTGNRITCRDWFQLTLKEGLTVYRDQEFSADRHGRANKRIADVRALRARQFAEDAGPLAHPVRPDAYAEVNNFYTATVYEKGAEVIRMIERIIGRDAFRRGMDRYVAAHDNSAATVEDFVDAMEQASGVELGAFRRWYETAGTPTVDVAVRHDAEARRLELVLRQSVPGRPEAGPLLIPVALALLGADGTPLDARPEGAGATPAVPGDTEGTSLVLFGERERSIGFDGVDAGAVPSLLRGFSAPVRLGGLSRETLGVLAAHDRDPFVRWDAGQSYATEVLLDAVAASGASGAGTPGDAVPLDGGLLASARAVLAGADADPLFAATALALPDENVLADAAPVPVDVDGIHAAREATRVALGRALGSELRATYDRLDPAGSADDAGARGRRALRNVCLALLVAGGADDAEALARAQFERPTGMTDRLAALAMLERCDGAARSAALDAFHRAWRGDPLVLDKWFAVQARSTRPDTPDAVRTLLKHPDFTWGNPNRVYALLGNFGRNQVRFHDASGAGYRLLADAVLRLDATNRSVAARLIDPLTDWRRFDQRRGALMRAELERMRSTTDLSRGTGEKVAAALAGAG